MGNIKTLSGKDIKLSDYVYLIYNDDKDNWIEIKQPRRCFDPHNVLQ
jgi:hypothetical protein